VGCDRDEAVVVVAPAVVTILLIECDTAGNCEAEELMMAAEEVAGDGEDGGGANGAGK